MSQSLEKDISKAVVNYLDVLKAQGRLVYYVNIEGGRRDVRQQVSLKRQGVRPGRPDIEVFANDNRVIFLELKRKRGGRVSEKQRNEIDSLKALGYECHVIYAETEADGVNQIQVILGQ